MFCPKRGVPVHENASFCPACAAAPVCAPGSPSEKPGPADAEAYAAARVEQLAGMVRDPGSLRLTGNILVLCAEDDGELNRYAYIAHSVQNGSGERVQGTAIFLNTAYIGDYYDDTRCFDNVDDKLTYLRAKEYLAAWNFMQSVGSSGRDRENWRSAELVDRKKIAESLCTDCVE